MNFLLALFFVCAIYFVRGEDGSGEDTSPSDGGAKKHIISVPDRELKKCMKRDYAGKPRYIWGCVEDAIEEEEKKLKAKMKQEAADARAILTIPSLAMKKCQKPDQNGKLRYDVTCLRKVADEEREKQKKEG